MLRRMGAVTEISGKPVPQMDLLRPDITTRVLKKQTKQKFEHDQRARKRTVAVGDTVLARNFGKGPA